MSARLRHAFRPRGATAAPDAIDERGFTLMELIVACTILGLIMVPLSAATIFFLRHGAEAQAQFQDDNGSRLAGVYFNRDIASATSVDVSSAGCGATADDTLVMSVPWTENGVAKQASWFTEVATDGTASLIRRRCTTGTPDETNTLASLSSAGSVWFAVTGGATTPTTVQLGFTSSNGLAATLSATPRWATSSSATVPSAPAGVSATGASGSAVVTWLLPATDGGSVVTLYTVTASPGGATCTASPPTTTCTLSGLTNGATYTVSVTATNDIGMGAPATASVTAGHLPGAPTGLSATGGDSQAPVSWTAPSSDGGFAITSYTATASPGGATCTATAPATTCTITGLVNASTYSITATATNDAGTGPASSSVSVTLATVPGAPTGVVAGPVGVVSTLAGSGSAAFADGSGVGASFDGPSGVAVDSSGNVYVADAGNNRVRKVTSAGVVSTLAGSGSAAFADGSGVGASFDGPRGIAVDISANVFVGDLLNQRLRSISNGSGQANVSFTAPSSDGGTAITLYTVTAAPGGATCTAPPSSMICIVSGLTNGTAYTFTVTAANASGSSVASSPSNSFTPTLNGGSDMFANATAVPQVAPGLPVIVTTNVSGATTETGEPWIGGQSYASVWFAYTPTTSGSVLVTTSGYTNAGTWIGLYEGSVINSLTTLQHIGGRTAGFTATVGHTYRVQVFTQSGQGTTGTVTFADNGANGDSFVDAIPVAQVPSGGSRVVNVDVAGASTESGEPWIGGQSYASVWFAYTPTTSGSVLVTTSGYTNGGGTWVGVYQGSVMSSLTKLQQLGGRTAGLTATVGQTYRIQVFTNVGLGTTGTVTFADNSANGDSFVDAIAVAPVPVGMSSLTSIDVTGCSTETNEPWIGGQSYASIWLSYTPAVSESITVTSTGYTSAGTWIGLYRGSVLTSLTTIQQVSGRTATFAVTAGNTYRIQVFTNVGQGTTGTVTLAAS